MITNQYSANISDPRLYATRIAYVTSCAASPYPYNNNNNNNNNNNLLTASGLSPGGSGYFTFKLRQTY
jgi:hypothetical protein